MSYVEYLYHFTCERCKLWWSIALDKEGWKAKKMWCPHCGYEQYDDKTIDNPIDYEYMRQ